MSKMIKTSLVALSLAASVSMGYTADRGGRGGIDHDGRSDREVHTPGQMERNEMLDPNSTGSIQTCDSQSYDEFGNCIVTPDMQ